MLTTQINLKTLKAVNLAASTEETRYYLNGVLVECYMGHVLYVATNGHIMLVAREDLPELEEGEQRLTGSFIIPFADCKIGVKGREPETVTLSAESPTSTKATMGNRIVTFIDGTFPNWCRVIPGKPKKVEHSHFNPEYVHIFGQFAKLMGQSPLNAVIQGAEAGDRHAVCFGDHPYFGVIVPVRGATESWSGLPDWAKQG